MNTKIRTSGVSKIVGYTYPTLHTGKKWYVDFYAMDPAQNKMRRKKYFISDDIKLSEKKRRAAEIIEVTTKQLMQGWNPWVIVDDTRGFVKFEDCVARYLEHVERMDRKKTRDSYRSRVNMLNKYNAGRSLPITYVYQFDEAFCTDFMDWIYLDHGSSPRTHNNYRGWLYGFSEFMITRKYIKNNPVQHIKTIAEHEKFRKDLTPEMLRKMAEHLTEVDKPFYLACLMQYYTLIRPGELTFLTIGDISLAKQVIFVSGDFSKNWRDAEVGLNKDIIKLMLDLGIFSHPSTDYIFSKNFLPGPTQMDSDGFNKRWKKMRKALGWEDCYQFYSLKDSGIRDLANAQGVVVARDQARHRDVTTTNKYIQQHGVQAGTLSFNGNLTYSRERDENVDDDKKDDNKLHKDSKN